MAETIKKLWVLIATLGALHLALVPAVAEQANSEPAVETEFVELTETQAEVQSLLYGKIERAKKASKKARLESVLAFYEGRSFEPIWIVDGKLTDRAKQVLAKFEQAREHALHPADYLTPGLDLPFDVTSPLEHAAFDIELSRSLVRYGQHLNAGQINPTSVNRENVIYPEAISAQKILTQASSTGNVGAYLRLLAPRTPRYERLRLAMLDYRALAKAGGWNSIEAGEVLKPEMEDARVPDLRKRLFQSGDFTGNIDDPSIMYDGEIVEAVKNFQKRHGLEEDGVVGGNTLKELNMTIEERIAMMELNLERRRWMRDDYGSYYIFANLADQVLKVVRDRKTIHAERIQVGKPYHRTPVFSDELEYIELNPYWNVPYSIATKELLPSLQKNAGKFVSQNYEVVSGNKVLSPTSINWGSYSRADFPFRLRQRPGDGNALGRVKFMFPNKFNVYIHDTPSKSKFDKASRFFSHGCLRLRDPLTMAEVILKDKGWNRAKIDGVVASKKRTVVKLDQKIPVHVAYMTSWVNKDGSVHFRRDVYGRDKILADALWDG